MKFIQNFFYFAFMKVYLMSFQVIVSKFQVNISLKLNLRDFLHSKFPLEDQPVLQSSLSKGYWSCRDDLFPWF